MHTLSVHQLCLQFAPGFSKVTFLPNPTFMTKVGNTYNCLIESFWLSTRRPSLLHRRSISTVCVQFALSLHIYLDRTRALRKSDQFFVSLVPPCNASYLSHQRLSHWIAEAIILGYNRKGLQPLEGLRTHSTRGIAISCALFKGISVQDIYDAAFCAILHIFFQFY